MKKGIKNKIKSPYIIKHFYRHFKYNYSGFKFKPIHNKGNNILQPIYVIAVPFYGFGNANRYCDYVFTIREWNLKLADDMDAIITSSVGR